MKSLLPLALSVVVLAACGGPRKACRKAEGQLARAVLKCPELLKEQVHYDTVRITLPAQAGAGRGEWEPVDMDSLLALCSELVGHAQDRASRNWQEAQRLGLKLKAAEREAATARAAMVQRSMCMLKPVTEATDRLLLKIWTENGEIRYWYNVLPMQSTHVVKTTTPQVAMKECPPAGVSSWWRWYGIGLSLLLLLVMYLLGRQLVNNWRFNAPEDNG